VPFDPAHCLPVHGTDTQLAAARAATEARHRVEDDVRATRAAKKRKKTPASGSTGNDASNSWNPKP
jgi:hypothetical protein